MSSIASSGAEEYLRQSAMVRMAEYFNDLATGQTQVPRQSVKTRIREQITDPQVLNYHDLMVEKTGPLFTHFLASVPCILEEMSRIGVALDRFVQFQAQTIKQVFTFYEVDAFDGSNGRTLANYSQGRIKTLTSSPNKANEQHFNRFADHKLSQFVSKSFLSVDRKSLLGDQFFWNSIMDLILSMKLRHFSSTGKTEKNRSVILNKCSSGMDYASSWKS
jgi:hypothetical protein